MLTRREAVRLRSASFRRRSKRNRASNGEVWRPVCCLDVQTEWPQASPGSRCELIVRSTPWSKH